MTDAVGLDRCVRSWTLFSAIGAPLFLISGWTLAAAAQHTAFDPVTQTISALAGTSADARWIMTCALYAVGACHVATGWGLRVARRGGRVLLALGGVSTLLVAAVPLSDGRSPALHMLVATLALSSLALWPLLAMRGDGSAPAVLRPLISIPAALTLTALLGWLGLELSLRTHVGLAERMAAGAQAFWPLLVVLGSRSAR